MSPASRSLRAFAIAAALIVSSTNASAQLLNGSFETPNVSPGYQTFNAGDTFGNWTVSQGNIELGDFWQAANGVQSIDLNGVLVGGVYQVFNTNIGSVYNLAFAMAGNTVSFGGGPIKSLDVYWNNVLAGSFTFDVTGHSYASMGWETKTLNGLMATGATSRLDFVSTTLNEVSGGAALDAIALEEIVGTPEPATFVLLATGLVLTAAVRRRRTT